jgi:alkylation response protein AidB-like acyl-CoA dehydrogenase
MNERASIGGDFAGDSLPDLLRLARSVEIEGGAAIDDAGVRQRIADFTVRSRGLRYTGYRTLTALSRGKPPGPEASMSKLVGGALLQEMGTFAMELQGAMGAVAEEGVVPQEGAWQERFLLAPGMRIAGGTDEVLRNIISERVLGLPPEQRPDKEVAYRDIPTGTLRK